MSPDENIYTKPARGGIPPRRAVTLLIGVVLLIVIFLVARWLLTNGNLELNFEGESEERTVQLVRQSDGVTVKTTTTNDATLKQRLPSGAYEVRVTTNYEQKGTTYLVTVPRLLGTVNQSVEVTNQFVRNRVGGDIKPCVVHSTTDLYSYGCPGSVGTLVWHKPLSKTSAAIKVPIPYTEESQILAVEPYKDNILVLVKYEDGPNPSILLVNKGRLIEERDLPETFISQRNIFLLRTDITGSDRFLVMRNDAEELLVFENFKAEPKTIKPNIGEYRRDKIGFAVDLANTSIMFANGHTSVSPDTPQSVKESGGKTGGDVIIYDTETGKESKKPFSVDGYVDSASFCQRNYICQLDDQTLHIIDITNSPKEVHTINNVLDYTSIEGNKLAYLQNGNVYVLDASSNMTQLAYKTKNFTINDLHKSSKGVLLVGIQSNSSFNSTTSAFLMEDTPATNNEFIDEKIPYPVGAYGFVRSFDYFGKVIRVEIQTARSANFGTGRGVDYDLYEFNTKKPQLLKELRDDGITPGEYTIIIEPFAF